MATGNVTYFNVTATETDTSFFNLTHVEGFHTRFAVIEGLHAHRNYEVDVLAFVYNSTGSLFQTPGAETHEFMTLPSG